VYHLTTPKTTNNIEENKKCGIYKLRCNTCKLSHVGQTNCNFEQRYQEHIRYIKQNDPHSAYAVHILNNNHECGLINTTMTLLKQITKTSLLIPYEQFYIQSHHYQEELILGQNTGENHPMYQLIFDPHITSPPAIHTIQYFGTLPLPRLWNRIHSSNLLDWLHNGTYNILITSHYETRYCISWKTFNATF